MYNNKKLNPKNSLINILIRTKIPPNQKDEETIFNHKLFHEH